MARTLERLVGVSDAMIFACAARSGSGKGSALSAALMQRRPRRIERQRHVGQHPLQALEFSDRPPELLALSSRRSWLSQMLPASPSATVPAPTRWLAAVAFQSSPFRWAIS